MELCWGDVGFLLSMPRQGLGNAAIAAVASDEQLQRFAGGSAAMAITEPHCGSDSAAIRTTARLDGDHYVLKGDKHFVTAGRSEERRGGKEWVRDGRSREMPSTLHTKNYSLTI